MAETKPILIIFVKSSHVDGGRTLWDLVLVLPDNQRIVLKAYSNNDKPHPRDVVVAAQALAKTDHYKASVRATLLALDVDDLPYTAVRMRVLSGAQTQSEWVNV